MRVQIIDLNSLMLQYYSLLYFYIVYCNAIKIRKNVIDASLFTKSNDRFCHIHVESQPIISHLSIFETFLCCFSAFAARGSTLNYHRSEFALCRKR